MPNNCKECFYKQNNVPEGGHCYMFKEEIPECQAFKPILENKIVDTGGGTSDGSFAALNLGTINNGRVILCSSLHGSFSAKMLLAFANLGSVTAQVTSEEISFAKAMAGPFAKNEPSFPATVNRRREGKTKRPKKW